MHIIHRWHTLHVLSTGILSVTNVHASSGIRASSYLRADFYIRIFGVHTICDRSASSAVCANSYAIHVSICTTLVLKVFFYCVCIFNNDYSELNPIEIV